MTMSDIPDFVEVEWLVAHLDDPRVRIVDARSVPHGGAVVMPSGREQFAAGHLPGAVHLDYGEDLNDPATPYATRVAPEERFAAVMGAHGIGDDALVVAYDAGTVPFAARMVWMLRYYGHDQAVGSALGPRPAGRWRRAPRARTRRRPSHRDLIPRSAPAARKCWRSSRAGAPRNWSRRSATRPTPSATATSAARSG
jgi:3-mercaptopyruvate sulfurtransferase SseA